MGRNDSNGCHYHFSSHRHSRSIHTETLPTGQRPALAVLRANSRVLIAVERSLGLNWAELAVQESLYSPRPGARGTGYTGVNGGYYTGERSNGTRIAYILIRFLHEILWNFSTYVYFSSNYRLISSRVLVSMQIHISGIFAS